MPRNEKPLDPTAGPIAAFAHQLRELRRSCGNPTYREMAAKGHYSPAALSVAAGGKKLPTWECALAYIKACGVSDEQKVLEWKEQWEKTRAEAKPAVPASVPADTLGALPTLPHSDVSEDLLARMRGAVDSIEEFVDALNVVRVLRGLSYRQVAQRSRTAVMPGPSDSVEVPTLCRSTIHDVLHRRAPVKAKFVRAYLNACGVPLVEIERWTQLLRRLTTRDRRALAVIDAHHSTDDAPAPEKAYELAVRQLQDALLAQLRGEPNTSKANGSSELLDAAIKNLASEERAALQRAVEMFRATITPPGNPEQPPADRDAGRLQYKALALASARDHALPASEIHLERRPHGWTGKHRPVPDPPETLTTRQALQLLWHSLKLRLLRGSVRARGRL